MPKDYPNQIGIAKQRVAMMELAQQAQEYVAKYGVQLFEGVPLTVQLFQPNPSVPEYHAGVIALLHVSSTQQSSLELLLRTIVSKAQALEGTNGPERSFE